MSGVQSCSEKQINTSRPVLDAVFGRILLLTSKRQLRRPVRVIIDGIGPVLAGMGAKNNGCVLLYASWLDEK